MTPQRAPRTWRTSCPRAPRIPGRLGCGRSGGEVGSAAVEATLLVPGMVMVLLFVVACGRLTHARLMLDDAAHQAARAASLTRSAGAARAVAASTARTALQPGGRAGATCADLAVDVTFTPPTSPSAAGSLPGAGGFVPGGQVSVTLTCSSDLSDVTGFGLPGTRRQQVTSTSAIDKYRGVALPPATNPARPPTPDLPPRSSGTDGEQGDRGREGARGPSRDTAAVPSPPGSRA